MIKGYKFRLYPTKEQMVLINKTFGCTRFIYNHFLTEKKKLYQEIGYRKTVYDCCKDIKVLNGEYPWLKEVDSCALRCAVFDLEDAYKRFFNKQGEYPRYKSKNYKNSYRTNNIINNYKEETYNSIRIDLRKKEIHLPKLKWLKIRGYRKLEKIGGHIINATVSKENNRYYVAITVEGENSYKETAGTSIIGIDLGIKSVVTTSENEKYDNQKVTKKYEKRLSHLQRELRRKEKGSKNYYKCLSKINVIYRKIKNTRKYYLHSISKRLTDNYKIIVTETLRIKNMLKNSRLSKSIQDVSLNELVRQLEYKSKNKGVKLLQVGAYYASSQICSCCGQKNLEMKRLEIREYECRECKIKIDRDLNAAINIMSEGLNKYIEELT